MENVYTVTEVAEYLKLSRSRVYRMVNSGEIPHMKIGESVRILESDLATWMEENRSSPGRQLGFNTREKNDES